MDKPIPRTVKLLASAALLLACEKAPVEPAAGDPAVVANDQIQLMADVIVTDVAQRSALGIEDLVQRRAIADAFGVLSEAYRSGNRAKTRDALLAAQATLARVAETPANAPDLEIIRAALRDIAFQANEALR